MKRAAPWEKDAETVSSSDTTDSDSDSDSDSGDDGPSSVKKEEANNISLKAKEDAINAGSVKKRGFMDFNALSRHGYRGAPSVLRVPEPRVEQEQDWSWSKGKREEEEAKESFEERKRTRTAVSAGETLLNVQKRQPPVTSKEKGMPFSQKEKRKRDLGQASRGKSYVEEEKRLLRESGIYSGFDT